MTVVGSLKTIRSNLIGHPFVSDTAVFFAGSTLVNVLNYCFVLIAVRRLDKAQFGSFMSLLAVLTLATVSANTLQLQATKRVAAHLGSGLKIYGWTVVRQTILLGGGALIIGLLVASSISEWLRVTELEVLILYSAVGGLVSSALANGFSSGLRWLKFQSCMNVAGTLAKLLAALILFTVGLGVSAGLYSYLLGYLVVVAGTAWGLSIWAGPAKAGACTEPGRDVAQGSLLFLVLAYFLVVIPFSCDQLLVQRVNPALSGDYAALATTGKLVFYAASPVLSVLYPYLVSFRSDPVRMRRYFEAGTLLTLLLSVIVLALLWLGKDFIVVNLMSERYQNVTSEVARFGLSVVLFVLAYTLTLFFIVREKMLALAALTLTIAAQVVLFRLRHGSLAELSQNQLLTCFGQSFLLGLGYIYWRRK
jgi:O-antigen/teichoic acid export membrane protein